jgi:hypothetical protein
MKALPIAVAFFISFVPLLARAQSSAAPATQGPMTVERLHNGFLLSPDVKITEVNHTTSELVGASAGWVTDETFFVGAGGYWLANQSNTRKMWYGGLVLQWLAHSDNRIGYGVKGLIGAGGATVGATVSEPVYSLTFPFGPDGRPLNLDPRPALTIRTVTVPVREAFFVAEPEANLTLRLTKRVRLAGGLGYRAVSRDRRDGTQLGGVAGSLGLQFDLGM